MCLNRSIFGASCVAIAFMLSIGVHPSMAAETKDKANDHAMHAAEPTGSTEEDAAKLIEAQS
ncbi:hypothetical protein JXA32_10415 [Candidatus Sumerlaeota bacterium]|nr:hypothetical protein [Candidatus Sumerlaeota bacterium]